MTANYTLDSVVVAARTQVSSTLGEEAAILDTARGVYFGLNPVGARIWSLIQQPRTVRELCDSIVAEYEVTTARCEEDVLNLLAGLRDAGLVESSAARDS